MSTDAFGSLLWGPKVGCVLSDHMPVSTVCRLKGPRGGEKPIPPWVAKDPRFVASLRDALVDLDVHKGPPIEIVAQIQKVIRRVSAAHLAEVRRRKHGEKGMQ